MKLPHRVYTAGWLAWIGFFLGWEGLALTRGKSEDTLSGHVWKWFGTNNTKPPTALLRLRRVALISLMAWLTTHFEEGGREV